MAQPAAGRTTMKPRAIAVIAVSVCIMLWLTSAGPRAATNKAPAARRTEPATEPSSAAVLPSAAVAVQRPPANPTPAAQVTHVTIGRNSGGHTVIRVDTTHTVRFTHFRLSDPTRVVVDLADTDAPHFEHVYPPAAGVLEDVRVAQFRSTPAVTRVVADLASNEIARIEPAADGVRIVLGDQAEAEPAASSRVVLRPVSLKIPAAPRAAVVNLARPVRVNWSASSGQSHTSVGSHPAVEERTAVPQPVRVAALAERNADPLLPGARAAVLAADVVESGSPHETMPVESSLLATPGEQQAPPIYTGKPISLDLKNVDILDFFRLIHQISGLNIIVDSDVKGRVTLVLNDVPWDQALDLVLKNNDLGKVLEGNVLRIAKTKTLTSEAAAQSALYDARIESEPLVTVFRRLKYAHAADQKPMQTSSSIGGGGGGAMQGNSQPIPGVATILKSFQKGTVLTARGNVVADPRDNAVIITDVASQIPVIEKVVNELDTKARQVSIQVRVILASSTFTRQLSSLLSTAFQSAHAHTNGAGATGQGITAVAPPASPLPALTAVTQPASVAATGFGAYSITTQAARYAINAAITAAEEHDQARTISRPSIVTQDNVRGEVQQGVQVPIQTDINNTIAIQYVNATLDLSVTPQVTVDKKIFLKIYVNNASIGTVGVFAGPTINTQEATTQVLVPDGGTVVFGGITVTTRGRSATYVPLLGSIPVIGNLFKSSSVNDQNQELLFFVSPTILPG